MKTLNYFDDCFFKENTNEQWAIEKMSETLIIYKKCINVCEEFFTHISELSVQKFLGYSKVSSLLIISRLLHLSQAIRILTLKGYYGEVLILQRSFLEGVGYCTLFMKNSEEAKKWYETGKKYLPIGDLFKMIPELKFNVELTSLYGKLCEQTHTNIHGFSLYSDFSKAEKRILDGKEVVNIGLIRTPFAPERIVVNMMPQYPLLILILLLKIYSDDLSENQKKNYVKRHNDLIKEYKKILRK